MASENLAVVRDLADWKPLPERALAIRIPYALATFARKKPLGFICGVIILLMIIVGDLVPVSVNGALSLSGTEVRVPYVADLVAPYAYDKNHLRDRLQGPSSTYWLGTDELGRDVFSRLVYGARVSVLVPFGAVVISTIIQILISVPSGYFGGWYDKIGYRLVDIADAVPNLVILITVLGLLGSGLWQMILAIGVLYGFGGRILRAQTIQLMAMPFIEAARTVGASHLRIIVVYILPNLLPLIILSATLRLGAVVLIEASLSFLGFGLPPPFPSWGQMLSLQGREYMRSAPGLAIYPGIAIGIVVFAYNLLGDALRDTLDPRLRGSK